MLEMQCCEFEHAASYFKLQQMQLHICIPQNLEVFQETAVLLMLFFELLSIRKLCAIANFNDMDPAPPPMLRLLQIWSVNGKLSFELRSRSSKLGRMQQSASSGTLGNT